jgi:dTMP kinase
MADMNLRGKFIVLDGPDGSGKGTQLDRLQVWLSEQGCQVLRTRDPGGTPGGDRIRHLLLDYDLSEMSPNCEALLFMASRAQLVHEVVRPALVEDQTVLCDRFISSTCAYQVAQGYERQRVLELGRLAVDDTWPDLTVILDIDPEAAFARTGRQSHHAGKRSSMQPGQGQLFDGSAPDAMERRPLEYHRRVRDLFCELPEVYPTPVVIVNADDEPDTVAKAVQQAVGDALG